MTEATKKRTVSQFVFDSKEARKIQRLAIAASVRELDGTPRHFLDPANPNHPNHDGIFGYDKDAFLAKQYR